MPNFAAFLSLKHEILMKNMLSLGLFLLFSIPFVQVGCQNTPPSGSHSGDVEVSPEALKTAEWAGFKYQSVLEKAKGGDLKAIREFYEFSGVVDGSDALGHAVSCLELIAVAGDFEVARALQGSNPKLLALLKDRLTLAQGRTKKTALQKPLAEWAPDVWAALNGKPLPVIPDSAIGKQGLRSAEDTQVQNPPAPDSTAARTSTDAQLAPPAPGEADPRGEAPQPAAKPKQPAANTPKQQPAPKQKQ